MTEPTRKKHTGEATDNVGHFGSKNQTESDLPPFTRQEKFVNVGVAVELLQHDPLPEWPEGIAKPEIMIDFDGQMRVYFTFRDLDNYQVYSWIDQDGVGTNISDIGDAPAEGWTDEQTEQIVNWAVKVTENLDSDAYGVLMGGVKSTERELIANATHEAPADSGLTLAQESAARVRRSLSATQGNTADDVETQVADAIADLMHFANAEGLDFDQLIRRARGYVDEENEIDG